MQKSFGALLLRLILFFFLYGDLSHLSRKRDEVKHPDDRNSSVGCIASDQCHHARGHASCPQAGCRTSQSFRCRTSRRQTLKTAS